MSFLGANMLHAQQGPPPIPTSTEIKKTVTDLSNTLELTDVQSKEVFDLYTAHFKEVSNKMESSRPSRKEMEALQSKFEKEVKAVLTTEQQKKYETYLKENQPKQGGPQQRR
ncbi:hypothetical protein BZG02_13425 [Labilibaculum filiforme]|uniref:DUF4890 domain-containing protein n=2 Tax=Labilibaculum filiforme TaxID=1940526 RepID=A0A2N3HW48_9BACT|nr:hypothetical protein BZG02_13425 [Labilibaculum filiforme]